MGKSTFKQENEEMDRVIGQRLRKFRLAAGLNQTELGELLGGLSFQQIQKYETGSNRVSATALVLLCKLFEARPEDVLGIFFDGDEPDKLNTALERTARSFGRSQQ